jgi:acetoin utilization protein AcuB
MVDGIRALKRKGEKAYTEKVMLVRDYMTRSPLVVSVETEVRRAFQLLKKHGFRQFPVVKDGKLVGIVTDRDLRTTLLRPNLTVEEIMTINPVTIGEDASLGAAMLIFEKEKFNALPVVSKSRELTGIITVTDVLDALISLLGFREAQTRICVEVPEGDSLPLWEIIRTIQIGGGEVLSVMSEKKDVKMYYISAAKCNIKDVAKKLREKGASVVGVGG